MRTARFNLLDARRSHVDGWGRWLPEAPQPTTGQPAAPATIAPTSLGDWRALPVRPRRGEPRALPRRSHQPPDGRRRVPVHGPDRDGLRALLAVVRNRSAVQATVHAYLDGRESVPLFSTKTSKHLDQPAAWRLVRWLARTAGVEVDKLNPHSFVTAALDASVPKSS